MISARTLARTLSLDGLGGRWLLDVLAIAIASAAGLAVYGAASGDMSPSMGLVVAHAALWGAALAAVTYLSPAARLQRLWLAVRRSAIALIVSAAVVVAFLMAVIGLSALFAAATAAPSLWIAAALALPAIRAGRWLRTLSVRVAEPDNREVDILAVALHELRQPLTTLVSASELALEPDASREERRELLERIHRQSLGLGGLLEEVLDTAVRLVESGSARLNRQATDVPALAADLVADLSGPRHERDVQVLCDEGGLTAHVDAVKLRIMLRNLISNAITYSPSGSTVTVRVVRCWNGVSIEVEDEGSGVPRHYREQIFERFFRIPDTTERGFGLGLYLTRQLVLAHDGTIEVGDGENGVGARFRVVLPAEVAAVAVSLPDSPEESEPRSERRRRRAPGRRGRPSRAGTQELSEGSATR